MRGLTFIGVLEGFVIAMGGSLVSLRHIEVLAACTQFTLSNLNVSWEFVYGMFSWFCFLGDFSFYLKALF